MSKEHVWPILRFLHDEAVVKKTQNNLPHWQFENSTVFLTFRLADSIPADILKSWKFERDTWLREYPQPWSTELEMEYQKRFSGAIDRYLDEGLGSCILRNPANAKIVGDAFQHFDHDRYLIHAWVIMPNHVHLLFSLKKDVALESIVTSWKRFTSRSIGEGPLWQRDYFDRLIRDWDHFINVARYIYKNPIKAKLREKDHFLYLAPWVAELLEKKAISQSFYSSD